MKDKNNNTVTATQEIAIIDTKEVLIRKAEILMQAGKAQALGLIKKYATVAEILAFKAIKESGEYKGLPYIDENGEQQFTTGIKDFCPAFLHYSYNAMQEDLQNLEEFGQDFFESAKRLGLGRENLRLLRQSNDETKQLIINSEAIDLGDKEAVKELFEDIIFEQTTEKAELKKQLDEANQTVTAVRENANEKQQELDDVKEREAKRRFSQDPWKAQTIDLAQGMINAKLKGEQAVNQMLDIFATVKNPDSDLDEKAIELCGRSLMAESIYMRDRSVFLLNEVAGIFGGIFESDMNADDAYLEASDIELP